MPCRVEAAKSRPKSLQSLRTWIIPEFEWKRCMQRVSNGLLRRRHKHVFLPTLRTRFICAGEKDVFVQCLSCCFLRLESRKFFLPRVSSGNIFSTAITGFMSSMRTWKISRHESEAILQRMLGRSTPVQRRLAKLFNLYTWTIRGWKWKHKMP